MDITYFFRLSESHVKNSELNNLDCSLKIPNQEVLCLYQDVFVEWLNTFGVDKDSPMIQHLLRGKAEDFCLELQKFFLVTLSVRDGFKGAVNKMKLNVMKRFIMALWRPR